MSDQQTDQAGPQQVDGSPQPFAFFNDLHGPDRLDAVAKAKRAGILHYGEDRKILGLPTSSEGVVFRRLLVHMENWQAQARSIAHDLRAPATSSSIHPGQLAIASEQLADDILAATEAARRDSEVWD